MPELPEVETVRQTLRNFILNHTILDVVVLYDRVIDGDTKAFIDTIKSHSLRIKFATRFP